jgi:hypothetical protein
MHSCAARSAPNAVGSEVYLRAQESQESSNKQILDSGFIVVRTSYNAYNSPNPGLLAARRPIRGATGKPIE